MASRFRVESICRVDQPTDPKVTYRVALAIRDRCSVPTLRFVVNAVSWLICLLDKVLLPKPMRSHQGLRVVTTAL